jgi:putative transposase
VSDQGEQKLLGFGLGASETEAFWQEFLRSLVQRGLQGVLLVVSDAHAGLKTAIGQVLSGASWQRCRVHFMRNLLSHIPRGDQSMVAAALRTIYAQPNQEAARRQLQAVYDAMASRWSRAAQVLLGAENDILACMTFPAEHWKRIYSNNVLERLNKEVRRRTNVVGVFPDDASVIRLVGAILQEQDDEWEIVRRYFSLESMHKLYHPQPLITAEAVPLTLAPVHRRLSGPTQPLLTGNCFSSGHPVKGAALRSASRRDGCAALDWAPPPSGKCSRHRSSSEVDRSSVHFCCLNSTLSNQDRDLHLA